MSKTNTKVTENLRNQIEIAIRSAMDKGELPQGELPSFIIEEPADRSHGDIATNVAMAGARVFRMAPVKAAQIILDNIDLENSFIEKYEIAGPGFINFFLDKTYFAAVLHEIEREGDRYGDSNYGQGKRVMVEFVSANPTGPMHLGNARGGALGDCLAAVMQKAGFDAYREFYVNDAGNQIEKFAASLEARYMQLYDESFVFPEDGYQGADIIERAQQFKEEFGGSLVEVSPEERRKALVDFALPRNIKRMQDDMAKYKIRFDNWFMESTLHESGAVKDVVDTLTAKGLTYEKDGAIWYKNKDVCTEILLKQGKKQDYIDKLELKDDVLIRSNGNPTYFAADIAYHKNKFDRGFEKLINVWGADHHGHVMRLKGAMDAVGYHGDDLDILLMQLVFRPAENVLYGILLVMIYTMVIDKLLLMGQSRTELKIISSKSGEIRDAILQQVDRGVTLLHGEGGYSGAETKLVLTVVSNRELVKAEKVIHQIDPAALIIMNRISEVQGRGFSLSKTYKKED